jgi:biopolymer transport protein ExbB/TolQ
VNIFLVASVGDTITDAVAEIASAMRYPVLILALMALGFVAYEIGRLAIEAYKRSQTSRERFDVLARQALERAQAGDTAAAQAILRSYAYGEELQKGFVQTLFATNPIDAQRALVDYDLYVSKRLDRVRLLVRSGPALGLMGTLIPLAPALSALGKGDARVLADELQTAFAITVVGVLIGLVAFTVALIRERYYTRDLADLEYLRELRELADSGSITPLHQPTASVPGVAATSAATSSNPSAGVDSGGVSQSEAPTQVSSVPGVPAQPGGGKKKLGIKRKPKPEPAPIAFPPPPPAPAPVVQPPADKSPSIPDAKPADPNFVDPVTGENVPTGDDDSTSSESE